MKITNANTNSFIKNIPQNITAILIYGQDFGLAENRILEIKSSFLQKDAENQGAFDILYFSNIKDNFEKVIESLSSNSLFWQGKKVCIIKECKDALSKYIKEYLDFLSSIRPNSLLILQADELTNTSTLRKLFEQEKFLAALPCYVDDEKTLRLVITTKLKDAGLAIESDALDYLANNLGNNRAITNSELDKLILYKYNTNKIVSATDVIEIINNNALVLLDKLHFSLFNFNINKAYIYVNRLLEEENPIFVIRALANHVQRIIYAKSLVENGLNIDEAIGRVKPMIFFTFKSLFKQQLNIWDFSNIKNVAKYLLDLEIQAKLNSQIGECLIKDFAINIKKWKA